MKILHFAPGLRHGGAAQLAADLACALQEKEVQNLLVAPDEARRLIGPRVNFRPYKPLPLPGKWSSILSLRRSIRKYQPQILQAYGCEAIGTAVAACRPLPPGSRPRVVGALTGYPQRQESISTAVQEACAAITTISRSLHLELAKLRPTLANRATAIPYGVDETLCHPGYRPGAEKNRQWQQRYPELKDSYLLCLPGPISAAHGTADIVPILSTLRHQDIPAHAIIAGDTAAADPEYLADLRRRLRAAGLDMHVTWAGACPDMRDVLCLCDVTLTLTARPAAYDRPILEALALGRPVVGYMQGAAGEYLEAFNPEGALPVGNIDAAADVLSQWYGNPPEGAARVPAPYRLYKDTAQSYLTLYNTLL